MLFVFLQDDHIFTGHATESGTGLYAKALAATVGANHFNRVTWGYKDPNNTESGRKYYNTQGHIASIQQQQKQQQQHSQSENRHHHHMVPTQQQAKGPCCVAEAATALCQQ